VFTVSGSRKRISIIYVDDEPDLLFLGKKFLEHSGQFDVEIATSSAEALALLQKSDYDGVVSDYQMPEMDGIGLLKNIRSRYPDLPFIIFTGRGREEIVIQAFDAGADYYVQKGGDTHSQFRELSHKIKLAVDKRKIEKALVASKERYRNVVEDQTEFICRFRPDGIHNFVNNAYCRYFGVQRESIIGHRFVPDVPAEDARMVSSHFASLTRNNPVGTSEHRVILPDGSVRWHQWSDRAIFNESGTLVEFQSVGRDITDRKTAELELMTKNEELRAAYEQLSAIEEALRTSYDDLSKSRSTLEEKETTLNAVIQESPIPQFVIDRNHTILYWNHALTVLTGMGAGQVIGTDEHWRAFYATKRPCMVDLLVDDAGEKIPEWYPQKITNSILVDNAYEVTDFFPHMGREGKWLHLMAGLIKDRNGETIGAVASLEDITERKTAELELKNKNDEVQAAYEQLSAIEEELRTSYDDLAKSQQALEEQERTLNGVIRESPIPQFVIDRNHTILYWNHALAEYSGVTSDEVIGTDQQWRAFYTAKRPCLADILMENDLDKIPELYPGKYSSSTLVDNAYEVTDFFPHMGREGKWLHFTAGLIKDRNGNIIGAVESLEDITDRKAVELLLKKKNEEIGTAYEQLTAIEEELRTNFEDLAKSQQALEEQERTLNAVIQESPIPQFVIGRNHTILYWNHALAEYSRVTADEVIGTDQQWRAFYPTKRPCLADLLMENDLDKIPEWYLEKYAKSLLIEDAYEATDFYPHMGREGKWLHFTAGLIKDRNGNIIGAVESLEDITDQKSAEQALRKKNEEIGAAYEQLAAIEEELRTNFEDLAKSQQALKEREEQYRNVVEDQTELICRFRPDGTHIFVNDAYCRYFNKTRDEITGKKFKPRIPADDGIQIRQMLSTLTPENPVGTIEQRVIFPEGSIRWQQWSDRAIFDPKGNVTEYQSVGRDITGQKHAENALRESEERYSPPSKKSHGQE
jgi:PAS domain S-box-containing protein